MALQQGCFSRPQSRERIETLSSTQQAHAYIVSPGPKAGSILNFVAGKAKYRFFCSTIVRIHRKRLLDDVESR